MSRIIGPMILAIVAVAILSGSAAGVAYLGGLLWERFESESVCVMYGVGVFAAFFVAFMGVSMSYDRVVNLWLSRSNWERR